MSAEVVSPPDVLAELRTATNGRHARLEALLDLTGALTRERYVQVLQGFQAFVPAWEARVQAALPERLQAWFVPRRRGGLITQDLARLGVATEAPRFDPPLPALGSLAAAFGSLYVMEGSTLGGQVIGAHLRRHLDITPDTGGGYFHGHGRDTGPMWKDFLAHLRREAAGDAPAAAQAAAATFDALIDLFQRVWPERVPHCHA